MNAGSYRSIQRACLATMGGFILLLFALVSFRSLDRKSLVFNAGESETMTAAPVVGGGSELHLQEFHRVEVRNGRKVWEVRAGDAKYFPSDSVVQVNEAEVMVYRVKGEPIGFRARSARLLLAGESLQSAELDGSVIVQVTSTINFQTETALYDSKTETMSAPGGVTIQGEGFLLQGEGLALSIPEQVIRLERGVQSQFETGAKVPTALTSRLGK